MATVKGRIDIKDLPARAGELTPEDLRKVTGGMTKAELISAVAAGKGVATFYKKPPAKKRPK